MREWLRRRWLVLVVAGWAVLLLVLGFAAYGGDATVPAQRDILASRAVVDRATVEVVNAAGADAAVRVGGFEFVETCRISLVRDGVAYRRSIELYPASGGEARLIETLARRLPAAYQARSFTLGGRPRLTGSADPYVPLRGSATGGVVRIVLRTDCHPAGGPLTTWRTTPSETERGEAAEALELTGGQEREPRWGTETIACTSDASDETALRAVRLRVAGAPARPLGDAAGLVPPDARVLVAGEKLLAYRRGAVSMVAETRGGHLELTTTTVRC
ncbi:MAG: hypothetical protein ACRDT6_12925 [Micromonosporaceae bacterium]